MASKKSVELAAAATMPAAPAPAVSSSGGSRAADAGAEEQPPIPGTAPSLVSVLRPAAVLLGVFTLLLGGLYPLLVTGAAQVVFPAQANGSLVTAGGKKAGSALIGQSFTDPGYFWGRPSATSPGAYNAEASSGSNLGPSNDDLRSAVVARIEALRAADPEGDPARPVPIELVTASGSGLDPDISPAAAAYQIERVARARKLPVSRIQVLVEQHTEGRFLGAIGEPRVNVLRLNLALAGLAG